MNLTVEQKRQLLSKIDEKVQKRFYDPQFKGQNWTELVSHYKDQIIHSSSPEAFEGAVSTLLSELHSSGIGLLGRDTKISSRNSISASFRTVPDTPDGDRWVFQDVQPGGVAERAGIRPADVLISIDSKAALPPEQPDFEMAKRIPIVISRNGEHTQVHLELRIPGPKYRSNPYSEPQSAVANMINHDLGYLKVSLFPGMIGIDFANLLDTLFDGTLQKAERLIIDLRGNPGGGIGGIRLMSYLTADKRPIGYTLDKKCTIEGRCDPQGLPRFGRIPKSKWGILPLAVQYHNKECVVIETEGRGPRVFHGKIVILINEHCTGAAEMVSQFAKENHLATLVGMKTAGRLNAHCTFKIGFGYRLMIPTGAYISWNGRRAEGHGIEPDVQVDWSFREAQLGRDTQFDRAIEVVGNL
ncbi:MAG TPA: S41 family peptidase [Bryobacteraceae bacterium]